ncbi:MAG: C40 family peptidase [Bacteroidia bacterium]|nr:C40 family peptidase [Bacteroidia bacterium]MDW8133526.1 C40 family peptidase [Bacteroidia bacterium]
MVEVARRYIGVPYKYGGTDKKGIDCSGLVCRVYQEALQLSLPRTAQAQAQVGKPVRRQLQPGDLVFFREPKAKEITHVGIVSEVKKGEVRFIHASSRGVREDSLADSHWRQRYVMARRVLASPPSINRKRSGQQGK